MSRHISSLRLTGGALTLLAAMALGGVASAAETLRVGKANGTSFVFALVDAGAAAGIFEKHGLTLEISGFGGGPKLQQALAAGSVDLGLSAGPDMALIAKGAPVRAVAAVFNGLDQVLVTNPAAGYTSVDDLEGKTFAASSPASLSGWLPRRLAETRGWGADGVTLQMVSSQPSAIALLETGQIDAMTLDPATAAQGEKAGKMKITYRFSELLPKFHQYAIYATDDVMASKPDALRAFLAGWVDTVAYARDNKDAVVKSMSAAIGIEEATLSGVYEEVMPLLSSDGTFDQEAMDILLDSFFTNGVLDTRPQIGDVTNVTFLP